MDRGQAIFLLPYAVSLGISLTIGWHSWTRREVPGARQYARVAFSQAWWVGGYICELLAESQTGKIFWDDLQLLGTAGWAVSFFSFSRYYSGRNSPRDRAIQAVNAAVIITYLILAFTNKYHNLLYTNLRVVPGTPFAELTYDFQPALWAAFAYLSLINLSALYILVQSFISSHPLYRAQAAIITLGFLVPLLGMILSLAGVQITFHRDTSPFYFAVSSLVVAWGLFRYRLFDLVPVARGRVLDQMKDAVVVLDADNRVVDINRAVLDPLGLTSAQALGRPAEEVFAPYRELVLKYRDLPEVMNEVVTLGERPDKIYIEINIFPLAGAQGRMEGKVLMARDVTAAKVTERTLQNAHDDLERKVAERTRELSREIEERKLLQDQLLQSQKMEAIGRLAGGIAHDFNNHLMVIINLSEILLRSVGLSDPRRRQLELIGQAGDKAAALTRQLLAFSRKQVISPRPINLNQVIADLKKMLARLIGEDINLDIKLDREPCWVMMDPVQVEQVIFNLAVNARDAMPRGGKLVIEVRAVPVDGPYCALHPDVDPGEYVMMCMADTGIGMDRETQKRIFEPFFTTKGKDRGTGLGLATVYGIVKQAGGAVGVYSEPGAGATFKILLPRVNEAGAAVSAAKPPAAPVGRGEIVLLVEDDDLARETALSILATNGYEVIEASSGEEAVKIFAARHERIALVVSDVIMTGMNGREMMERLREVRPEVKSIYLSGYSDDIISNHGVLDPGIDFLQKPFNSHHFLVKVREVLDRGQD